MKAIKQLCPIAIWLAGIVVCCSPAAAGEITVAAASSLTDALTEIGAAYEARSGDRVVFSFGASSTLARQIDAGAPVDLFISADLKNMESLEQSGWIEEASRKELLSNKLVMAVAENSRLAISAPADLLRDETKRIALAEPSSVPVGVYARRYLEEEGIWSQIQEKVIPVRDARATLASVESGEVDVGFVYKTDAAVSKKVKVVYEVPREKGPEIIYPAAVIKESGKKQAARNFLNFLSSDTAGAIFKKYGFIILG